MEKNLLRLNRSAESVMLGYVILIAIAVALATGVFFYLKLYLPSEKPECYQDIDLVIDEVACNIVSPGLSNVEINFTNKGLFNVDAAYIKIGDVNRVFRTTLNDPDADRLISPCNNFEISLKPGAKFCSERYTYTAGPTEVQEISVEPLIWIDNAPVLCPQSIVKKRINCV